MNFNLVNIAPLKLTDLGYLFDPTPRDTFLYAWPVLIFIVLLFLGSFYVARKISESHTKNTLWTSAHGMHASLRGLPARMREFAFVGFILLFLRSENVPYLGMRIWLILWGLAFLAYLIFLAQKWKKEKEKLEKQSFMEASPQKKDYLPRPKKRRKKRT